MHVIMVHTGLFSQVLSQVEMLAIALKWKYLEGRDYSYYIFESLHSLLHQHIGVYIKYVQLDAIWWYISPYKWGH